jgi:low temperature requirement protein LtrA
VALGKLTHLLAHTHHGRLGSGVWGNFILTFIPMWWIWVGHTVCSNRFDADTRPHRIATLFLMLLIMLASVQIGDNAVRSHVPFVVLYVAARLFIAASYFWAARVHRDKAKFARQTGMIYCGGALLSLSSVLFQLPVAVVVFYAGLLFDIVAARYAVGRSARSH